MVKTRYVLEGPATAPVVVMAHALGSTLELWSAQAAALVPTYRVLRYDVRGHGRTEVPEGPYALADMAGDVRDLLDALDVGAIHFIGLSMGGLIGMALALAHPRRVRSLVLCDTTACYGSAVKPMWDDRIRVAQTDGMTDELIEKTMAIWFTPGFRTDRKAEVDRVRTMLRNTDPRGYVAAVKAIANVDLRERIGAIACPTLVVVGEKDPGTPPAMARVIHERIDRSRLLVIPGAMHCSVVESPATFTPALREFLSDVAA